ncbi:MAG: hypothetical protein NZ805_09945 [Armatimonadetes bacterium]|nr:hypothetical protein [Armatimonadota bacterium]
MLPLSPKRQFDPLEGSGGIGAASKTLERFLSSPNFTKATKHQTEISNAFERRIATTCPYFGINLLRFVSQKLAQSLWLAEKRKRNGVLHLVVSQFFDELQGGECSLW